jgi:ferritin-like protein
MRNSFSLFNSVAPRETNAAKATLVHPIEAEDCSIAPEAVTKILNMTKGYHSFLREWGK